MFDKAMRRVAEVGDARAQLATERSPTKTPPARRPISCFTERCTCVCGCLGVYGGDDGDEDAGEDDGKVDPRIDRRSSWREYQRVMQVPYCAMWRRVLGLFKLDRWSAFRESQRPLRGDG